MADVATQAGRRRARRRLTDGPCTWCGTPTFVDLPRGHPQRATWDHVIPRSLQPRVGYQDLRNLVRACWTCNSRRGARDPAVLARHRPQGGPSREW